jgi:site-specific DNA recombinase
LDRIHEASDAIECAERIVVARGQISIHLMQGNGETMDGFSSEIRIPWPTKPIISTSKLETDSEQAGADNENLVQAIVRAHTWRQSLLSGTHGSVEKLAEAHGLHPKVVRQALRLAFLSPDVTSAALECKKPAGLSLARIPKLLPLPWAQHQRLLG